MIIGGVVLHVRLGQAIGGNCLLSLTNSAQLAVGSKRSGQKKCYLIELLIADPQILSNRAMSDREPTRWQHNHIYPQPI